MGVNQDYKHSELIDRIIGVFYEVYNDLAFGFFESVYRNSFRLALIEKGGGRNSITLLPISGDQFISVISARV